MAAPASQRLIESARALLPRAAAPYSKFRVAAVLEDETGATHPGVNVESVSFDLTLCAERTALAGAIAHGAQRFTRIAIVADRARPVLPCGACRQVLLEHAPDLIVVTETAEGGVEEVPLRSLLPRPFLAFESGS